MKKAIALLLVLTMVFALAACGKTEAPAETPAENPAEAPAEPTTETPAETAPVYDEVNMKLSHVNAIDQPIGRHPNDRKKMAVNHQNGKRAVTHYRVLQRFQGYTYIECVLETGRTHQIRVHMASIGHPLLGDEVYSNRKSPFKLQGQTLHAKTLGFIHPTTGEYLEIDAPLPEYFEHLLTVLEK